MSKPPRSLEPIWIEARDALAIHERLLALEGGPAGVRDKGLLESALARPRQLYSYGEDPSIQALAAAYLFGIVRSHPFLDGNKRTGFVIALLFLELNGHPFVASEEDAARAVMNLAEGTLDEASLIAWLAEKMKRR